MYTHVGSLDIFFLCDISSKKNKPKHWISRYIHNLTESKRYTKGISEMRVFFNTSIKRNIRMKKWNLSLYSKKISLFVKVFQSQNNFRFKLNVINAQANNKRKEWWDWKPDKQKNWSLFLDSQWYLIKNDTISCGMLPINSKENKSVVNIWNYINKK